MNVKSLRTVCIKLDKTVIVLNPNFMKDFHKPRLSNGQVCGKDKMSMIIPECKQIFSHKLWNC